MLVIVRHGRTAHNASGLLLGRLDPPLDELGRLQAAALAAAVGPVDRVISSPLLRTRETAEAFGCDIELDERWIELDYGEYDGVPLAEVPPEIWAQWRADVDFRPPGGETLRQLGTRVRGALDELAADVAPGAGTTVVVTHVSPVKAAVGWTVGAGDDVSWRLWVAPASITRIGITPRGGVLHSFNETAHLD
jgi:broad specificity phosphatase PhoE